MSLIIPTAATTYGDSTFTEGHPLARKHVLAQFRGDADLEWVARIRSMLVRDELKYVDFRVARPKLKLQRALWQKIESGVGQASIVVIDPDPTEKAVRLAFAEEQISPETDKLIIDQCATAIVAGTPVAYLPNSLTEAVPWGSYQPIASLDQFTPKAIRDEIGGGLKQAMIFAARAHAVFDLRKDDAANTTRDVFRSPLARVLLAEMLATERHFDAESPTTAHMLNKMADEIADSLGAQLPLIGMISDKPLVREIDSKTMDAIQAADIAAGWAREQIDSGDPTDLAKMFDRVWINGKRIK